MTYTDYKALCADNPQQTDLQRDIYTIATQGIAGIIAVSGGNGAAMGRKYGITPHTLQNWRSGVNKPAAYLLDLLGYAVINDKYDT